MPFVSYDMLPWIVLLFLVLDFHSILNFFVFYSNADEKHCNWFYSSNLLQFKNEEIAKKFEQTVNGLGNNSSLLTYCSDGINVSLTINRNYMRILLTFFSNHINACFLILRELKWLNIGRIRIFCQQHLASVRNRETFPNILLWFY